ncbi:DNA-binding protein [Actinobacillus capsulatus]|uniref:DNA-binding protein n=1 Tax=Actinobacillus capsulatus TaxID=717 RepID=UPI00036286F2|nr:DNA-binding protein [Actinobacillus capsulatus]
MQKPAKTADEIKAEFRARGETFSHWAKCHGYNVTHVSRVLNGTIKASYGKSHEIAVKLGLKVAA